MFLVVLVLVQQLGISGKFLAKQWIFRTLTAYDSCGSSGSFNKNSLRVSASKKLSQFSSNFIVLRTICSQSNVTKKSIRCCCVSLKPVEGWPKSLTPTNWLVARYRLTATQMIARLGSDKQAFACLRTSFCDFHEVMRLARFPNSAGFMASSSTVKA